MSLSEIGAFVTNGSRFVHYAGARVAVTRLNACLTIHNAASVFNRTVSRSKENGKLDKRELNLATE